MISIKIQKEKFDINEQINLLKGTNNNIGAISSFIGCVRDKNDNGILKHMELEHYPVMTEKSIKEIIDSANKRWEIINTIIIHRVGILYPFEPIVLVLTSSKHRLQAIKSCHFIIDYLKNKAPFWKKETNINNSSYWVIQKQSDIKAEQNWL